MVDAIDGIGRERLPGSTGRVPAGQIAGIQLINGQLRATVWDHGTAIELGAAPGTGSYAFGINAAGQVVGHSQQAGGTGDHATLWTRN